MQLDPPLPLPLEGLVEPTDPLHLHAGQYLVTREPIRVTTVLGSCVSVVLFDPASGIAALNHYLLPTRDERRPSALFGDVSLPALFAGALRLGARAGTLRAQIIGGSARPGESLTETIAHRNVAFASDFLRAEGIPFRSEHVGGPRGRRLWFDTASGTVSVRSL